MSKVVKIIIKILIVLLIIFAIAAGIGAYYVKDKLSKINYVPIEEEKIEVNEGVGLKGYRNIAIFGVDSRSDSYDTGTRSDCIIIAAINQETNDVKLVSVYRDTYVQINNTLDKITHAYSYGGAELALNTLNKNLDLNITEFVAVNFDAVVEIINAIGGVEIEIIPDELNYINGYIADIDKHQGTTTTKITNSGKQTLNGVQALAYSRIRYTEGGDYKRTERMRDVIIAAFNKGKKMNVTEINKIIDIILPKVYTNITANEILALVPNVMKYNINTSIGWPYKLKGVTLDRWYGVPVTLESNVVRLHQEIFEESEYQTSQTVKDISQKIRNKIK